MTDELMGGIRTWLDKSGRALELRVARVLRRARAQVLQSFSYQDPTTGTQREGDVLASFWWNGQENTPCALVAVVEANSGAKHPWVAFYDGAAGRGLRPGFDKVGAWSWEDRFDAATRPEC